MSCIKYDDTVAVESVTFYRAVLQTKIMDVCRKIHFNDSHVTWIIFDASLTRRKKQKKWSGTSISTNVLPLRDEEYAYCDVTTNEIYISTEVIRRIANSMTTQISFHLRSSQNVDWPAEVIIHEITHIQTKRDHDNPIYIKKYHENMCWYLKKSGNIF